jgi:phage shock protein PspC (stress-responsive transcriptional regulator)
LLNVSNSDLGQKLHSHSKVGLGVCSTVAERLGIEPFCVRVVAIILAFSSFPIFLAGYVIAGIAINRDHEDGWMGPLVDKRAPSAVTLGWIALAVGGFFLVSALSHWIGIKLLVGMALIGLGVNVVMRYRDRADDNE